MGHAQAEAVLQRLVEREEGATPLKVGIWGALPCLHLPLCTAISAKPQQPAPCSTARGTSGGGPVLWDMLASLDNVPKC